MQMHWFAVTTMVARDKQLVSKFVNIINIGERRVKRENGRAEEERRK
jgi:hypothetical protein